MHTHTTSQDKPTRLGDLFSQSDRDRITEALINSPNVFLQGPSEGPPHLTAGQLYGIWLDALGLPDLADRARTELADAPKSGLGLLKVSQALNARSKALSESNQTSVKATLRWAGIDLDTININGPERH